MREFFKSMFRKNRNLPKHVRVVFSDPSLQKEYPLYFELYPGIASETWLQLLQETNRRKSAIQDNGQFYGSIFHSIEEVTANLQSIVATINASGIINIPHRIHQKLTRKELNELHEIFECLMAKIDPTNTSLSSEVYQAILDLNTWIHCYESTIDSEQIPWIIAAFQSSARVPLTKELLSKFTMDRKFGELMMSYSTIGVSYLDAFDHKPEAPPVPQQTASADIAIHLGKNEKFEKTSELAAFLKSTYGKDIHEDNLALGKIPLGRLVCQPQSAAELLAKLAKHKHIKTIETLSDQESIELEKRIPPLLSFRFGSGKDLGRLVIQCISSAVKNSLVQILEEERLKLQRYEEGVYSFQLQGKFPGFETNSRIISKINSNIGFDFEKILGALPKGPPKRRGLYFAKGLEFSSLFFLSEDNLHPKLEGFDLPNCYFLGDPLFSFHLDLISQEVVSCELETLAEFPSSNWYEVSELRHHLDYCGYLDLGVRFQQEALFQEAYRLLPKFVPHREYDNGSSTGQWKSLGIKTLDGDPTKTEHFDKYAAEDRAFYPLTSIADDCPATMQFLSQFVDLDSCKRIRFMLLEPGAKIRVHNDAPVGIDTQPALNIALNMPKGCEFTIEALSDGTSTSFTKKIPFRPGSAMLVNVAKYHYVENLSAEHRIHIIVHGPIRIPETVLVQKARKQNLLKSEKEVVNQLVVKRAALDLPMSQNLYQAWLTKALDPSIFAKAFRIVVVIPKNISPEKQKRFLNFYTIASLFPLEHEICETDSLNDWLKHYKDPQPVLLLQAGIFLTNVYEFIFAAARIAYRLKRDEKIFYSYTDGNTEICDSRFTILNPEKFRDLGQPDLFQVNASKLELHPAIKHLNVAPGSSEEGSIADVSLYAPKSAEQELAIAKFIEDFESYDFQRVYPFNNEPLWQKLQPGFHPDRFLSVAAGFKPTIFVRDHFPNAVETVFLDRSVAALKYYQELLQVRSKQDCIGLVAKQFESLGETVESGKTLAQKNFHSFLKMEFKDRFANFRESLAKMNPVKFQEIDFLRQQELLLSYFEPGKKTIFWYSNSWRNNSSLYRFTRQEIETNFREFVKKVAQKTGQQAWINTKGPFNAIIGESFSRPEIYFIDNLSFEAKEKDFTKVDLDSYWNEVPVVSSGAVSPEFPGIHKPI